MRESIALLIMLAIFPSLASAQQTDKRPRPPSVTANGEAVITVEPDQAKIDIGVVTQARNAPEAAKGDAEKPARGDRFPEPGGNAGSRPWRRRDRAGGEPVFYRKHGHRR